MAPGCNWCVLDNTALGQPCPKHGEEYLRHFCDEVPEVDMWGCAKGDHHDEDFISALESYGDGEEWGH